MGENDAGLSCPRCEKDGIDARGFQQHLRAVHDVSPTSARVEFQRAKAESEAYGSETAGSGEIDPSDVGGARGVVGSDEPPEVQGDPRVRELDKQVAEARRLAELKRLDQVIDDDDEGADDVLETIGRLRQAGLISDGRDETTDSDRMIIRELRNLREEMQSQDGGGSANISLDGDVTDPLQLALASGADLDSETLSTLASASPEVVKERIKSDRERERYQRRAELVDRVLERFEGGVGETLIGALVDRLGDDGDGGGRDGGLSVAEGPEPVDEVQAAARRQGFGQEGESDESGGESGAGAGDRLMSRAEERARERDRGERETDADADGSDAGADDENDDDDGPAHGDYRDPGT